MRKGNVSKEQQIIVHIPHSSISIPSPFQKEFLIQDDELNQELLCMTDWYTDELFSSDNCIPVIHTCSRLVCDPERFLNPYDEGMYQKGMGMYYTHTAGGKQMKRHPLACKESLDSYGTALSIYEQHHNKLRSCVNDQITNYGSALIIDGHSFPSVALPYEPPGNFNIERPDICIGADNLFTPDVMVDLAKDYFEGRGLNVMVNTPFVGTLVPDPYYTQKSMVVKSIMIEVNRKLYMDEKTGEKLDSFSDVHNIIKGLLQLVYGYGCIYCAGRL